MNALLVTLSQRSQVVCFVARRIAGPLACGLALFAAALLLTAQPRPAQAAAPADAVGTTYSYTAYLPLTTVLTATSSPWVNTSVRQASRDYYLSVFAGADDPPPYWTGDFSTCDAGTINPTFRMAALQRVNYY